MSHLVDGDCLALLPVNPDGAVRLFVVVSLTLAGFCHPPLPGLQLLAQQCLMRSLEFRPQTTERRRRGGGRDKAVYMELRWRNVRRENGSGTIRIPRAVGCGPLSGSST